MYSRRKFGCRRIEIKYLAQPISLGVCCSDVSISFSGTVRILEIASATPSDTRTEPLLQPKMERTLTSIPRNDMNTGTLLPIPIMSTGSSEGFRIVFLSNRSSSYYWCAMDADGPYLVRLTDNFSRD